MRTFSPQSLNRLNTCHPDLIRIFTRVIEIVDCTVICGNRTELEQNEAVRRGFSKLMWPHSLHNKTPSLAVDVVPYPIDWDNRCRFYHFAGVVRGVAAEMEVRILWGGDWGNEFVLNSDVIGFDDLPHFELLED